MKIKQTNGNKYKSLAFVLLMTSFLGLSLYHPVMAVDAPATDYNPDIANKIVTRCDLIKDYLSKSVRIGELATRQNKVRGWEYILRQMNDMEGNYGKFSVDYSELETKLTTLRQQLEQFKVDFEAYDNEFQRLLSIDCRANPSDFWKQLGIVRGFRAGISISSENYKKDLANVIDMEELKW